MRQIYDNQIFSGSSETRSLVLIPGSETIDLQLECDGAWETMATYTANEAVDLDLKDGMTWRVAMSDSGSTAKAFSKRSTLVTLTCNYRALL